jgi:hypothetical protein
LSVGPSQALDAVTVNDFIKAVFDAKEGQNANSAPSKAHSAGEGADVHPGVLLLDQDVRREF